MSPASSGSIEVERYIGACLISSQSRNKNSKRENTFTRESFVQPSNYPNGLQRCNSTDRWAGGMPLISFANHQRWRRLSSQEPAKNHSIRNDDQKGPLSRLVVHTQGAPLILTNRYSNRKGKNNRKSTEQSNGGDNAKKQDGQACTSNGASADAVSVASDESSGSANAENCLPRIIKPRKRRKKDRKPPHLTRPLSQDGSFSTDSASPEIESSPQSPLITYMPSFLPTYGNNFDKFGNRNLDQLPLLLQSDHQHNMYKRNEDAALMKCGDGSQLMKPDHSRQYFQVVEENMRIQGSEGQIMGKNEQNTPQFFKRNENGSAEVNISLYALPKLSSHKHLDDSHFFMQSGDNSKPHYFKHASNHHIIGGHNLRMNKNVLENNVNYYDTHINHLEMRNQTENKNKHKNQQFFFSGHRTNNGHFANTQISNQSMNDLNVSSIYNKSEDGQFNYNKTRGNSKGYSLQSPSSSTPLNNGDISETPKLHHAFEDVEDYEEGKDVNGNASSCQCRYCDPSGQIWDIDRSCYSPFLTNPFQKGADISSIKKSMGDGADHSKRFPENLHVDTRKFVLEQNLEKKLVSLRRNLSADNPFIGESNHSAERHARNYHSETQDSKIESSRSTNSSVNKENQNKNEQYSNYHSSVSLNETNCLIESISSFSLEEDSSETSTPSSPRFSRDLDHSAAADRTRTSASGRNNQDGHENGEAQGLEKDYSFALSSSPKSGDVSNYSGSSDLSPYGSPRNPFSFDPSVLYPSSRKSSRDLEVSTEIVTSLNGHRDLEIKFFSMNSPDNGDVSFYKNQDNAGNASKNSELCCVNNNNDKFIACEE